MSEKQQPLSGRKVVFVAITTIIVILTASLSTWVSLLLSKKPLDHTLSFILPWPVVCSMNGCITTASWYKQHVLSQSFAQLTSSELPSPDQSLTTAIRRHMAQHAFLRSPVSLEEARQYREAILNITDDAPLKNTLNVGLQEYDRFVILPFLQQEALRAQYHVESTEELYKQLNEQHPVHLLLFRYRWDAEKGTAVAR